MNDIARCEVLAYSSEAKKLVLATTLQNQGMTIPFIKPQSKLAYVLMMLNLHEDNRPLFDFYSKWFAKMLTVEQKKVLLYKITQNRTEAYKPEQLLDWLSPVLTEKGSTEDDAIIRQLASFYFHYSNQRWQPALQYFTQLLGSYPEHFDMLANVVVEVPSLHKQIPWYLVAPYVDKLMDRPCDGCDKKVILVRLMTYWSQFDDPSLVAGLLDRIKQQLPTPWLIAQGDALLKGSQSQQEMIKISEVWLDLFPSDSTLLNTLLVNIDEFEFAKKEVSEAVIHRAINELLGIVRTPEQQALLTRTLKREFDFLIEEGRADEALVNIRERWSDVFNQADVNHYLAKAYLNLGQDELAIKMLETIVKNNPDAAAYKVALARVHRKNGRLDSAINHYLQLNGIQANKPILMNDLAELYLEKGDFEQAQEWLDKTTAADKNGLDKQRTLKYKTLLLLAKGQLTEARNLNGQQQVEIADLTQQDPSLLLMQSLISEQEHQNDDMEMIDFWLNESTVNKDLAFTLKMLAKHMPSGQSAILSALQKQKSSQYEQMQSN